MLIWGVGWLSGCWQVSLLSILVVLMECQPSLQLPALRIAGAMISAAVESGVVVDHFQQPFAHILNCRTATRSSGQGCELAHKLESLDAAMWYIV